MNIKKIVFVLCLIIGMSAAHANNAKLISISFKYSFKHANSGTDINTRLKIYVDDVVKGVSLEKMETASNHVTIQIPAGTHKIRAVIESEFEHVWEEHTIVNEYSIDCVYLKEMNFTKNFFVELIFDLEKGTIVKNDGSNSGTFYNSY